MRRLSPFAVFLTFILGSTASVAGNNAGGTAYLTWNRDELASNLASLPSTRFPLFLRIQGAPDIVQLAVNLQWTPQNLVGPCYYIVPDSSVMDLCGWNTNAPPGGPFAGDSSYVWTLGFPPGTNKTCVVFWISGERCDSVPSTFCLTSVLTMDSAGAVDTLVAASLVTALGGTTEACPAPITPRMLLGVSPTTVYRGEEMTLTVVGRGLHPGTTVALRGPSGDAIATSVVCASPDTLLATIEIPSGIADSLDLVVHDPIAGELSAHRAVQAATCTYRWGVLVDGHPPVPEEPTAWLAQQEKRLTTASCPPTRKPITIVSKPSVTADLQCPGLIPDTSTNEVAYFLLRSTGDTIKTSCPILLTISPWDNTGGHCHTSSFFLKPTGTPPAGTYSGNLLGGYWRVQHTWPDVSGYILTVVLPQSGCPLFTNSENFWLSVKGPDNTQFDAGLVPFPPGLGYYVLGPGQYSERHPDHNFITPKAGVSIVEAVNAFEFFYGGRRDSLPLEEMSLAWGGLDDADYAAWAPGLCGHRSGDAVDMRLLRDNGIPYYGPETMKRIRRIFESRGIYLQVVDPSDNCYRCEPMWHGQWQRP